MFIAVNRRARFRTGWLIGLAVVSGGCRPTIVCGEDGCATIETTYSAEVVRYVETIEPTETIYALEPITSAVSIRAYGDETVTVLQARDGKVEIPVDTVAIEIEGGTFPPAQWLGIDENTKYLIVDTVVRDQRVPVDDSLLAVLHGRISEFTPSSADEFPEVTMYWKSLTGAVLEHKTDRGNDYVAVGRSISIVENEMRAELPEGSLELLWLERIREDRDPASYKIGRMRYEVRDLVSGIDQDNQDFVLDKYIDSETCSDQYDQIRFSWPTLDRSFIRGKTGGVQLRFDLETPFGNRIPYFNFDLNNTRIREGNAVKFQYPHALDQGLEGAAYLFASVATRQVEGVRDVVRFVPERTRSLKCEFAAAQVQDDTNLDSYFGRGENVALSSFAMLPITWPTDLGIDPRIEVYSGQTTMVYDYAGLDRAEVTETDLVVSPAFVIHVLDQEMIPTPAMTSKWEEWLAQTDVAAVRMRTRAPRAYLQLYANPLSVANEVAGLSVLPAQSERWRDFRRE